MLAILFRHQFVKMVPLQGRHNERVGISNYQPHDCLLNRLFGRRSKKTSKFRVTALCVGNSPVNGEFPAQRVSNAEDVSILWRHHAITALTLSTSRGLAALKWCERNSATAVRNLKQQKQKYCKTIYYRSNLSRNNSVGNSSPGVMYYAGKW